MKPSGYWKSFDKCLETAVSVGAVGRKDFSRKHRTAYESSRIYGHLETIAIKLGWSTHQKSAEYWSDVSNCVSFAKKYKVTSRHDWQLKDSASYTGARLAGNLDSVMEILDIPFKKLPVGYWNNPDLCLEKAIEVGAKSRFDWCKKHPSSYNGAYTYDHINYVAECVGWKLNALVSNRKDTVVYWYFDGEFCYVGETAHPERRHRAHMHSADTVVGDYFHDEPEYLSKNVNEVSEIYRMSKSLAYKWEKRLIINAAESGIKVLNHIHNPQWDRSTKEYSWK